MRQPTISIDWLKVFGTIPGSPSSPVEGRPPPPPPPAGQVEIDWIGSSSSPDRDFCFGSPSPAPHAAAARAGSASAAKRARAGAGDPARGSSIDKQRPDRRFEALRSKLDRCERSPGAQVDDGARRPVTRAAAKAAAGRGRKADARAAAKNVFSLGQEDEGEDENLASKYCLKPSPVLDRKKNHGQADDRERDAHPAPAAKNGKEASPPEEIFEALRAIPSLARDDLLRAYSMLIRDDRQFRSLLALPMDMRKDWLLMEIGNQ